jgi:two-component system NtrC family sensor kinase
MQQAPGYAGRDVQQRLRVMMAAAVLLPTALFTGTAWLGHREAFAHAEQQVIRSAVIAREHGLKMLRTDRLVLDRVDDLLAGLDKRQIEARHAALQPGLQRLLRSTPELRGVRVWNAEGRLLLRAAPGDASTDDLPPEVLAVHRAPGSGLWVLALPPVPGRPGPRPLLVTQRRSGPVGELLGISGVTVDGAVFNDFYRDLIRTDPGASVSLFRHDGTLVVREPLPPPEQQAMVAPPNGAMMQRVLAGQREGVVTIRSPVDGKRRLVAFRQLDEQALYVSATISYDAINADWIGDALRLAAFTFPTALALAWVSWVALQHTRREHQALQRWRDEIAKRAQVEDALRQTQRLEALGHLTGGVAHDVNNLLMVVSNNAYLLQRRLRSGVFDEAQTLKPLDAILRAVATGARLTRQLLAFARRQALRPEVMRLQDQLPLLLDLMRHSVTALVSVEGEAAPACDCVQVDPAELELALLNLAVNARDAMPAGGRLRVSARRAAAHDQPPPGRWVLLSVSDTGSGIAPEHLARVFEPFFTTKETGKGTGLGLSQVYGFCEQAGGSVRIHSTPGQGTTVTLLLPAVDALPEPAAEPAAVAAAQGRLLLVEDNADVAAATEPLLANWGYQVRSARSGDAAWQLLQRGERPDVDLMLSDIVMPGMLDGLTLAQRVRRRWPHIGVVLMTGHATETGKALDDGFTVLQKPWTPQALAAALEQARPRTPTDA